MSLIISVTEENKIMLKISFIEFLLVSCHYLKDENRDLKFDLI